MAIDKEFFGSQLAGALYFWIFSIMAHFRLKEARDVETFFAIASGSDEGPHPEEIKDALVRAFAKAAVEGEVGKTHARHKELTARALYVYAWSALDHLLESCVREAYLAEPKRLAAVAPEGQLREALSKVLDDAAARDEQLRVLTENEVRAFSKRPLSEQFDFFEKRLGIALERAWLDRLLPVNELRNRAAHEPTFPVPPDADLFTHVGIVTDCGKAIADRCLERISRHREAQPQQSPESTRAAKTRKGLTKASE